MKSNQELTDEVVQTMMRNIDTGNKGKLCYEVFVAMVVAWYFMTGLELLID